MAKVIDFREIRRKKIIAQYIAFYGTTWAKRFGVEAAK